MRRLRKPFDALGRALATALLAFAALSPAPIRAQVSPTLLAQEAAEQLGVAHAALEAASGARDRVAALTQTISAYEDGLEALREGLRRAAIREAAITRQFEAESEHLSKLLGVMLSLQKAPTTLSLLHPSGPIGTARSGMILSDVAPAFQAQVDALKVQLDEVAALRTLQQSAAQTLTLGLTGVQSARTELSQAISQRTDLPRRFLADPAQLQRLIDSSETLEGFAAGLGDLDSANGTSPMPELSDAMGTLQLPANGAILRRADEADAAGIRRPGWLIATRPRALVTTPWPATIRYLGPFLDYGNVIILEPGNDILMVLAGLDQVYGEVGEVLKLGAPIGLMGGQTPDMDAFLINTADGGGAAASETLYIEIRQGGSPVDPAQWFAENKE
ncbi:MAG: murein hydrolase activator EnvC family protein [Paracoccaceae bacterium]